MPTLEFSARHQLELSTDGVIPRHLWRAAEAIDATARAKRGRLRYPRIGRVTLKDRAALARMVAVILEGWRRCGVVAEEDFRAAGIPAAQARRLKDTALRRAALIEPRVLHMEQAQ